MFKPRRYTPWAKYFARRVCTLNPFALEAPMSYIYLASPYSYPDAEVRAGRSVG